MTTKYKVITIISVISVFILLLGVIDIKNTYIELSRLKNELSKIKSDFNQYKKLSVELDGINNKLTQELSDAKTENNKLYSNVINGLGRLQFNIDKATPSSVDDEKTCELSGEARQNYHLLRDDIITKDKMIIGLQKYVHDVCLIN
ncbi:lysis system i-spanin subunit Rz (plasmid) [Orbus sturtevantii]|uniref:lysis system i-spanin subunit Rz n=1 Tax=Orbus sturtevantii TaxID=3074109 RepID=UPI00370D8B58